MVDFKGTTVKILREQMDELLTKFKFCCSMRTLVSDYFNTRIKGKEITLKFNV